MTSAAAPAPIRLVYRDPRGALDAVWQQSERLVGELRRQGVSCELTLWDGGPVALGADVAVIQYSPFSWGRRGIAVRLIAAAARHRLAGRSLAIVVHEPFVPSTSLRWVILGAWQRAQLRALLACAGPVLISTEAWRGLLPGRRARRAAVHLPVGSNLPDQRPARDQTRARLGVGPGELLVCAFGTDNPGRPIGHVAAAVARIAERGPVHLQNLGANAPAIPGLPASVRAQTPGPLDEHELARRLGAADLVVAPFVDGVSARRTSVVAALQHEVAVVGTSGASTEPFLRDGRALALAPADDVAAFADLAAELAADAEARRALAHAGRHLFERRFAWPVVARILLDALEVDAR